MRRLFPIAVLLVAQISFGQQPGPQPELSARDVFWSASDLVSVAPNPGTTGASASKTPETRPPEAKLNRSAKPASTAKHQIDPTLVRANGYGAQPHLVRLSSDRIGLRYTLLEKNADGRYVEVLPSNVFHSGDRVKVSVMANHGGYLYIIQQGSSGNWSPIYPNQEGERGSNYIEPGKVYEIPNNEAFELNGQPGKEHVYLLLSLIPIKDLDGAIFGLGHEKVPSAPSAPTGAALDATNRITDTLVQQLVSRDLVPVQEQVSTSANGGDQQGEKAVYVVNSLSAESNGSKVVAKLVLDHE